MSEGLLLDTRNPFLHSELRLLERFEARGKLIDLRARAILGEESRHGEAAQRVAEAREMWADMRNKKLYPQDAAGLRLLT